MADRASYRHSRAIGLAGAFALAAVCAACSSVGDTAGFGIVTQDKFDFNSCPEILTARNNYAAREKELAGLMEKADASPGGIIVSYAAYRSELTSTRAILRAAERAAQLKGCNAPKPKL